MDIKDTAVTSSDLNALPFPQSANPSQSSHPISNLQSHDTWINTFIHPSNTVQKQVPSNDGPVNDDDNKSPTTSGSFETSSSTSSQTPLIIDQEHQPCKSPATEWTKERIHQGRLNADQNIRLFLEDLQNLQFVIEKLLAPAPPAPPTTNPGQVQPEPFIRKRIHPIPLTQVDKPLEEQVNEKIYVYEHLKQLYRNASRLLSKESSDLKDSICTQQTFFRDQIIPLRNRCWQMYFPNNNNTTRSDGGLYGYLAIDYSVRGYDPPMELIKQGRYVPTPGATLFPVTANQVLPNRLDAFPEYPATPDNPSLVRISDNLRLHLGGGGFAGRRRGFYVRYENETVGLNSHPTMKRPTTKGRKHCVDTHLRRAQANFITEIQMHRLLLEAKQNKDGLNAIIHEREINVPTDPGSLRIGVEDSYGSDNDNDEEARDHGRKRKPSLDNADDAPHQRTAKLLKTEREEDTDSHPLSESHLSTTAKCTYRRENRRTTDLRSQSNQLLLSLGASVHELVQANTFTQFVLEMESLVIKHVHQACAILPMKLYKPRVECQIQPRDNAQAHIYREMKVYLSPMMDSYPTIGPPTFSLFLGPPRELMVRSPDTNGWTGIKPSSAQICQLVQHHVQQLV